MSQGVVQWIVLDANGAIDSLWIAVKSARARAEAIGGSIKEMPVSYGDGK